MNIGAKIKELRIKNKITQDELAKVLHLSTQAISKWENGGLPDLELIPAITSYFKVSSDYLFGIEDNEILNFENKLYKYITSFKMEKRIQEVYRLGFLMSIATRGDYIENINRFEKEINEDDYYSVVSGKDGIMITSLAKSNKFFGCMPKDSISNYLKLLETKDNQMKFCRCLGDELFYNILVFLYSRNIGNFTEKLLIDNFKTTDEKVVEVLDKMIEFNIVNCKNTKIDGKSIKLYTVSNNPHIVLLFAMLDMTVNKHNNYCYYFGGPTDFFNNKVNKN